MTASAPSAAAFSLNAASTFAGVGSVSKIVHFATVTEMSPSERYGRLVMSPAVTVTEAAFVGETACDADGLAPAVELTDVLVRVPQADSETSTASRYKFL